MPEILYAPAVESFPTGDILSCLYPQIFPAKPSTEESEPFDESVILSGSGKYEDIEPEFNELVKTWKAARTATSFSNIIVMHPAYQRIIGLGKKALPLILAQLRRDQDHWFWALKAISGEDPVPAQHRGNIQEMTKTWLEWGRKKGYVR